VAEAPLPGRDLEACREALHVPLERAGEGFVEVVEVEDQVAFGRSEAAEVQQVSVARELHVEPSSRRRGEVVRHHHRRAAVERQR
jgi:hypothetical protein